MQKFGINRQNHQRYRCKQCGKTFADIPPKPLDDLRVPLGQAVRVIHLLAEGVGIRAIESLVFQQRPYPDIATASFAFGVGASHFRQNYFSAYNLYQFPSALRAFIHGQILKCTSSASSLLVVAITVGSKHEQVKDGLTYQPSDNEPGNSSFHKSAFAAR
jgi:hypothetical protein